MKNLQVSHLTILSILYTRFKQQQNKIKKFLTIADTYWATIRHQALSEVTLVSEQGPLPASEALFAPVREHYHPGESNKGGEKTPSLASAWFLGELWVVHCADVYSSCEQVCQLL